MGRYASSSPPREKRAAQANSRGICPENEFVGEERQAAPSHPASRSPLKQTVKNEREFQDDAAPAPQGMGTGGKALVAFALLIFLGTLGVVGFFVYKNMDKFVQ